MDPATVIALCKENIQPLRHGRNAAQLGTALRAQEDTEAQQMLMQEKQMYEDAIKNYDGDDPLENWYEYILWMEQSYPKSGHESHICKLLQQCLATFEKDPKYSQDRRYIRLWINYISLQKNPLELYQLLYNNGIGTMVADMYRAWAFELEQIEDYKRADQVYLTGMSTLAEPREELDYAHKNFQLAIGRRMLGHNDGRGEIPLSEQRQAFSSLRAIKAGRRVTSTRTGHRVREYLPGTVQQTGPAGQGARSNARIQIYQDETAAGDSKGGASILDHVPIEDSVHKENSLKPGPWSNASRKGPLMSSDVKPAFKVHEDRPDDAYDLEHVRLGPNHTPFFDGSKYPEHCMIPVYVADAVVNGLTMKPHYPKDLVYANNSDRSMEEIKAERYLQSYSKNCEEKNLMNESSEQHRESNGDRLGHPMCDSELQEMERREKRKFEQEEMALQEEEQRQREQQRRDEQRVLEEEQQQRRAYELQLERQRFEAETLKLEKDRREAQQFELEQLERERQRREAELERQRYEAKQLKAREASRIEAERIEAERIEAQRMEAELQNSQRKLQTSSFLLHRHHTSSGGPSESDEHLLGQSLTVNTKEAMSAVQDLWHSPANSSPGLMINRPMAHRIPDTRAKLSFDIHMDSSMTQQHAMSTTKDHPSNSYHIQSYHDQENHQQFHNSYGNQEAQTYTTHAMPDPYQYQVPQQHHDHRVQSHIHHQHHHQQHIQSPQQHIQSPQQHIQSPQQHIQSPQQHIQSPQQHIQSPQQHIQTSQQHIQSSQQHIQSPQQHIQSPQQHFQSPQQHIQTSQQHIQSPQQQQQQQQQHHQQQHPLMHHQQHQPNHQSHLSQQSPHQMQLHHSSHSHSIHHHQSHHSRHSQQQQQPHHSTHPQGQHLQVASHLQHQPHVYGASASPATNIQAYHQPYSMALQCEDASKQLHFTPYVEPHQEEAKPYKMPEQLPYIKSPGMNRRDLKYLESADNKENASVAVDYNNSVEEQMPKQPENNLYVDESLGTAPLAGANDTCYTEAFNAQLPSSTPLTNQFRHTYRPKDVAPQYPPQNLPMMPPQGSSDITTGDVEEKLSTIMESTREYVSSSSGSSGQHTRTVGLGFTSTREELMPIKEQSPNREADNSETLQGINNTYEDQMRAKIQAVHAQSPRTVQRNVDQITSEIKNNCDLRIPFKLNSEPSDEPKADTMECEDQEPMEQVEEEEFQLPTGDINPFDKSLIAGLLRNIKFPQSQHSTGYLRLNINLTKTVPSCKITLGNEVYEVEKCLGKGTYGTVVKAIDLQTGMTVALKTEKPAWVWEYYIAREIKARLTNPHMLRGFMDIDKAYVANNGSVLVSQFSKYGTLLAVTNQVKIATGKPLVESLAIYFTIEMLKIVEHLHKCQIIHGDIKPDNFLLMHLPTEAVRPTIQLIDFGCSIDMSLLPEGTQFKQIIKTQDFTCIEMQTGRPWTYQTDLYCVAASSHCLLFGNYMRVSNIGGRWVMNSKLPRYSKKAAWERFFGDLLNIESCDTMPDLASLRNVMEEALAEIQQFQGIIRQFANVLNKR